MLYRIDYSDGDWEEMTQLQLECNLVSREQLQDFARQLPREARVGMPSVRAGLARVLPTPLSRFVP